MKKLTVLAGWEDCQRCRRYKTRLGLRAKFWPRGVQVVVIGLAASRGAQVSERDDPALLRYAEAIRDGLGLGTDQVVCDVLLACGLGEHDAEDVAGCGQRFVEQDTSDLRLVVLRNQRVAGLARAAGLYRAGEWCPIGKGTVAALTCEPEDDVDDVVNKVRQRFGLPRKADPHQAGLERGAKALLDALGAHEGRGQYVRGGWSREMGRLTLGDVRAHLRGQAIMQAYDPKGPWPYAVLDIDRHSALQDQQFDATLAWVRAQFKRSLVVSSSASGGVHVYVRLPPDLPYKHAATWLQLFVTARRKRWFKVGGVQAELIEVPRHPVRLPFGPGSSILGSSAPLEQQLADFISFLTKADSRDYERAEDAAVKLTKIPRRWSSAHRRRISRWLAKAELGSKKPTPPKAPDPWANVFRQLPDEVRVVAAQGVPALGTRTRWTKVLVSALVDLVPRNEVEILMRHWIIARDHVSEDIEADPIAVTQQTLEMIDRRYKKLHGIPTSAWDVVRGKVRQTLRSVYAGRRDPLALSAATGLWHQVARNKPYSLADLERTAFFLTRRFYDEGVRVREVWGDELERFTGSNTAADVRTILTGSTWLRVHAPHVPGEHSTIYELDGSLWPAVPGSSVLMCLP